MTRERIDNATKFFADLGGLHDAKIVQLSWTPRSAELVVSLDDLRANFAGLPEHGGTRPAILIFGRVKGLSVSVDSADSWPLRVFEVECPNEHNTVLLLSPSGRIDVQFESLVLEGGNL